MMSINNPLSMVFKFLKKLSIQTSIKNYSHVDITVYIQTVIP